MLAGVVPYIAFIPLFLHIYIYMYRLYILHIHRDIYMHVYLYIHIYIYIYVIKGMLCPPDATSSEKTLTWTGLA